MNEEKLVEKAQKGDYQAFERLYKIYFEKIYRFCFFKVGNHQEAEDLTSEVFVKVLESLGNFSKRGSFKNWIYAIAKNTVGDYFRRSYKIKKVRLEDWLGEIEIEENPKYPKRKEEMVRKILEKLPKNYRQVLKLRFLKGYSIKEIAQKLGISQENVKIRQYRALKAASRIK